MNAIAHIIQQVRAMDLHPSIGDQRRRDRIARAALRDSDQKAASEIHFAYCEGGDPIYALGIESGADEYWIATRQKDVALKTAIQLFEAFATSQPVQRQVIGAYHARPSES